MKVLFISLYDWANVGKSFELALKSVGEEAKAISLYEHDLLPIERGELVTDQDKIQEYLDWADIVVCMHSELIKIDTDKPIWIFHGGTKYRQNHKAINKLANPLIKGTLTQTYDLLGLGAKNEHWVMPPVDTEGIQPVYHLPGDTFRFAHYPRSSALKGSADINYAICGIAMAGEMKRDGSPFTDYLYSDIRVSRKENLRRISNCDVYIESQTRVSDWGMTTLEAAALGKIVITNFKGNALYYKEFGKCPILCGNDIIQLENKIYDCLDLSADGISDLQHSHRQWVEKYHSYKAVGERLRRVLCV